MQFSLKLLSTMRKNALAFLPATFQVLAAIVENLEFSNTSWKTIMETFNSFKCRVYHCFPPHSNNKL